MTRKVLNLSLSIFVAALDATTPLCVTLTFFTTADASSSFQSSHGPRAATVCRSLFRLNLRRT
jgi:hypothetical protein